MPRFVHLRHREPTPLDRPRELVVACCGFQSHVNLSRIVRAAGCFGIQRIVVAGPAGVDRKIARDGADQVVIENRRTIGPALLALKASGLPLIGLEQVTESESLYDFAFPRACVLVVGHERHAIPDDVLAILDHCVEIPSYGLPYSHNLATATCLAMSEYCRRWPSG